MQYAVDGLNVQLLRGSCLGGCEGFRNGLGLVCHPPLALGRASVGSRDGV